MLHNIRRGFGPSFILLLTVDSKLPIFGEKKVMEKTKGAKRVKVDFNVTNDSTVDQIKVKSAELIDLCEGLKGNLNGGTDITMSAERARLIALAQTAYEEACMWAVKANFTE